MGMDMGNTDGHMEAQLRAWTDEHSRRASHKGAALTCTHTELDSRGGSRVRKGASLFGSPVRRGTVARQLFAPPPRRGGGEKQQHPPDRSEQFALGLCAGEGRSPAPTDTPGAVIMGDLVVLLADSIAVMRQPARARSGEVV